MAMLAERRQKERWVLNPRQTAWSKDGTKFGQKYLEKLGWKSGQGIGANLQGRTEHVKVSVRSDNRGVGFKGIPEDVLPHQNDFSDLLARLATDVTPVETELSKEKSLEAKSRKSKARVHYQKFTRSKDLTTYSQKDLACILGKPAKGDEVPEMEQVQDSAPCEPNFVQRGSMQAYFTGKLKNRHGNLMKDSDMDKGDKDNSDTCDIRFNEDIGSEPPFISGFIQPDNSEEMNNNCKKSKKRVKVPNECLKEPHDKSYCPSASDVTEKNEFNGIDKKVRKKRKRQQSLETSGNENDLLIADCIEPQTVEKNEEEYVKQPTKKQKMSGHRTYATECESSLPGTVCSEKEVSDENEAAKKTRKKRRKKAGDDEVSGFSETLCTEKEFLDKNEVAQTSTKKRRKKIGDDEIAENHSVHELLSIERLHVMESEVSSSKKKSRRKREQSNDENVEHFDDGHLLSPVQGKTPPLSRSEGISSENIEVSYRKQRVKEDSNMSSSQEPSLIADGNKTPHLLGNQEKEKQNVKKSRKKQKTRAQLVEDESNNGGSKTLPLASNENLGKNINKTKKKCEKGYKLVEDIDCEEMLQVQDRSPIETRVVSECVNDCVNTKKRKRSKTPSEDEPKECASRSKLKKKKTKVASMETHNNDSCLHSVDSTKSMQSTENENEFIENVKLSKKKVKRVSRSDVRELPLASDADDARSGRKIKSVRSSELLSNVTSLPHPEQSETEALNSSSLRKRTSTGNLAKVTIKEAPRSEDTKKHRRIIYSQVLCHLRSQTLERQPACERKADELKVTKPKVSLVKHINGVKYINGVSYVHLPRRLKYAFDAAKKIPLPWQNDAFDGFPGSNVEQLGYG